MITSRSNCVKKNQTHINWYVILQVTSKIYLLCIIKYSIDVMSYYLSTVLCFSDNRCLMFLDFHFNTLKHWYKINYTCLHIKYVENLIVNIQPFSL